MQVSKIVISDKKLYICHLNGIISEYMNIFPAQTSIYIFFFHNYIMEKPTDVIKKKNLNKNGQDGN